MSELLDKQLKFGGLVGSLILEALRLGYQVKLGEAWRSPETAKQYAADGRGISNSLHISNLAIDLLLFRNGKWLTNSEDYLPLGEWWEKQDPLARWGGRFRDKYGRPKPDGNHFSLEHLGVK
jgi:hypothetical protein